MAGYAAGTSIGARIAAARRARGFRSTKELAAAMQGTGLTESVLENIEAGRRSSIDVSHILNLAKALGVPLVSLLAPMARPDALLDLPNLSSALAGMTAGEFDSWMSSIPNADYTAESVDERNDRAELLALRELQTLRRDLRRREIAAALEARTEQPEALRLDPEEQMQQARDRIDALRKYLSSAGWEV